MASAIAKEPKLTEIPEELVNTIIQLRKRKYTIRYISRTIGLEPSKVSRILLNNLNNRAWKSTDSIASPRDLSFARDLFDEIGDEQLKKEYLTVLQEICEKVKQRGGFGPLEKLSPVVSYLFLKSKGYEVKKRDLLQGTDVTGKEFARRLIYTASIFPMFKNRDKTSIVLSKLYRVQAHFNLSDEFAHASLDLFRSLYPRLRTTTESVAAGTICVLTAFKLGLEKPSCYNICRFLRIADSAVHYNIKHKVFPRVKLEGLVGSREVIRDILCSRPASFITSTIDLKENGSDVK